MSTKTGGWFDVPVVREVEGRDVLADLYRHSQRRDFSADKVTAAHETTHYLNAQLRWEFSGYNALYALWGRATRVKEPPVTLRQLAALIEHRGPLYQLYIVEAANWWNQQPLYIADEWTAYRNGTLQAESLQEEDRAGYSLLCTVEMLYYLSVLRANLPGGYQRADFDSLWDFARLRSELIYQQGRQQGWADEEHRRWIGRCGRRREKDNP